MAKQPVPIKPAKKTPVFKAEVIEDSEVKIELTDSPIPGMDFQRVETPETQVTTEPMAKYCPIAPPSDFLTSKGFSQVHQGQRINATFEEIQELLKEYRAL